jgi:restriction system protein
MFPHTYVRYQATRSRQRGAGGRTQGGERAALPSGSRSEWERQQAAMRRELQRQARERARLEREREKTLQQQHLASQQEETAARTAALSQRIAILDQVLTGILTLPPLSFERLKVTPQLPPFDSGPLANADSAPDWNFYAPPDPGIMSRIFGGTSRHERRMAEAHEGFETAIADYRQREADRLPGACRRRWSATGRHSSAEWTPLLSPHAEPAGGASPAMCSASRSTAVRSRRK